MTPSNIFKPVKFRQSVIISVCVFSPSVNTSLSVLDLDGIVKFLREDIFSTSLQTLQYHNDVVLSCNFIKIKRGNAL